MGTKPTMEEQVAVTQERLWSRVEHPGTEAQGLADHQRVNRILGGMQEILI